MTSYFVKYFKTSHLQNYWSVWYVRRIGKHYFLSRIKYPATTNDDERSWRRPGSACFLLSITIKMLHSSIVKSFNSIHFVHFPLCTFCDCVCLFNVWVKEISGISWYHISIFSDIYRHVNTQDVFTWSWSWRSEGSCNICMQLIGCYFVKT